MKKLRHIFPSLLSLVMIILTGCAADDLQWGGRIDTEEEIAIAFSGGDMKSIEVATRGLTLPSTEIGEITLLIFDEDENLSYGQHFSKSEFISSGNAAANAVKLKRQYAAKGTWYLLANAKKKIDEMGIIGSDGLPAAATTLTTFENNTLTLADALGTSNNSKALLVAKKEVGAIPGPSDPALEAFTLQRQFAKVTMKVGAGVEFRLTGIALFRLPASVKMDGSPTLPLAGFSDYAENELLSLPIPDKMGEEETYPEARLIIKGYNPTGRDTDDKPVYDNATETYFAYKFPGKIEGDHEYALTLKSVVGDGATDPATAAANPVGAVIEYSDRYNETRNIVTDGERVIALPDTLRPAAADTQVTFDVIWRGKEKDDLLYYPADGDELIAANSSVDSSWLKAITASEPSDITSEDADAQDSDFKRFKTRFTLTLTPNEGSEREASLCFRLKDSEQLLPVLVIAQQAPANINLDDSMDIKLEISRGSEKTTIDNYLIFIGNNPASGTKAEGVAPDCNGGRIRNAGLHFPMPNSTTTYTYTLSGLDGWDLTYGKNVPQGLKATGNGSSYTFTYTDSAYPSQWSYDVYEDAIILTKGSKTLTLDIYHTGFFHLYGGKWLYYEVFSAAGQHWLDRNIGATSAGMAHLEDSYVGGSDWPMRQASGGEYFSLTDAKKEDGTVAPPGWHLPTQGDFEMLAMQSGFSSDRFTTGGRTIFLPSYTFSANIYPRNGAASRASLRAYFPHNKYKEGGISGDAGAGYYWTSTNTDNAQYYRSMKFVGQNVTPENMLTSRRLSLRCVAGEGVDNSTYLYSCQVKGYTHVFLYAEKDGVKTYLNTWPGTQVANEQMKEKRFNPFTYTSFIDYQAEGYDLYVIFNNPTSSGTESNVSSDAAKSRQGIPFLTADRSVDHNGEGYDYSLTGSSKLVYKWKGSDIVLAGNWKKYVPAVETFKYAVKGNFNGKNWDEGKIEELNESSPGIWTIDIDVISTGEFVLMRKQEPDGSWGDYYKADGLTDVKLNEPMTIYTGKGDGNNWRFTSTGKYTLTLNINANTLTVTKRDVKYSYAVKGNFNNKGWSTDNSKVDLFTETSSGSGIWTVELNVEPAGEFVIMRRESTETTWSHKDYYKADGLTDVKLNEPMTIYTGKGDGNNWRFTSTGKYTLTLRPDAETLTVTKEPEPEGPHYFYLLPQKANASGIKMEYDDDLNLWTLDLELDPYTSYIIQERKSDGSWVNSYRPVSDSDKEMAFGETLKTTTSGSLSFKPLNNQPIFLSFDPVNYTLTVVPQYTPEWWVNVKGNFNSWGNNGAHPNRLAISTHENQAIGNGDFKINVYYKDSSDQEHEFWYSTSDGKINAGEWVELTANNDYPNLKINGANEGDKFKVEFNCWTRKVRLTKVTSQTQRRRPLRR